MPLQARLSRINALISKYRLVRSQTKPGTRRRRQVNKTLRKLHRTRLRLRLDRWKLQGTTAIIKYEVIPLLDAAGVPVTSRKRWETYGNPSSDHYRGNRDADAVDGGTASNYSLGNRIKQELTGDSNAVMSDYEEFLIRRSHTGNLETYRVQIIAGTHGTGPHIHIGAKRAS